MEHALTVYHLIRSEDGNAHTLSTNRAYPAVLYTQVSDITHSWIGYKLSAAGE